MKNAYAVKLQQKKQEELADATAQGFMLGTQIAVVALNNVFGFGYDRLKKLEAEMNRIWIEEFCRDMETASYGLSKRIEQIGGKK